MFCNLCYSYYEGAHPQSAETPNPPPMPLTVAGRGQAAEKRRGIRIGLMRAIAFGSPAGSEPWWKEPAPQKKKDLTPRRAPLLQKMGTRKHRLTVGPGVATTPSN